MNTLLRLPGLHPWSTARRYSYLDLEFFYSLALCAVPVALPSGRRSQVGVLGGQHCLKYILGETGCLLHYSVQRVGSVVSQSVSR